MSPSAPGGGRRQPGRFRGRGAGTPRGQRDSVFMGVNRTGSAGFGGSRRLSRTVGLPEPLSRVARLVGPAFRTNQPAGGPGRRGNGTSAQLSGDDGHLDHLVPPQDPEMHRLADRLGSHESLQVTGVFHRSPVGRHYGVGRSEPGSLSRTAGGHLDHPDSTALAQLGRPPGGQGPAAADHPEIGPPHPAVAYRVWPRCPRWCC